MIDSLFVFKVNLFLYKNYNFLDNILNYIHTNMQYKIKMKHWNILEPKFIILMKKQHANQNEYSTRS
jgi:hypothetical protein